MPVFKCNIDLYYTWKCIRLCFVLFCFVFCFAFRCVALLLFYLKWIRSQFIICGLYFNSVVILSMLWNVERTTHSHTQNAEEKKSVIATLQMWVQHVWLITYKMRKEIIHCEITYDNPWYTNMSGCINKHQNTQQLSCRHNLSLIADRSI